MIMRVIILLKRFCIFLCLVLLFPVTVYGSEIEVSASACVAIDGETHTLFYERNKDTQLPIASTTKIMTCLIACESGKLNKVVTVTDKMLAGAEGSLIYLKSGDKITLYDLVAGAMLASGNDAAQSIAVYLAGSESKFALLMNKKAKELGMKNTYFVSASGLDKANHHSTAYDMALLASTAIKNKKLAAICKLQSAFITVNSNRQKIFNHNKLLHYDSAFVGMKTGYTQKAGRCLVSVYSLGNSYVVIVTLNDPNDWQDHKKLADYSKSKYTEYSNTQKFYLDIVGSEKSKILCSDEYRLFSLGEVKIINKYYPFVYATVRQGDTVGVTEIYINKKLYTTVDITAVESVEYYGK